MDSVEARHAYNMNSRLGSLPSELLFTILEFAAAPSKSFRPPDSLARSALMRSCSMLREAALSTPYLWSFIDLVCQCDVDNVEVYHSFQIQALQTNLMRSGTLKLLVKISILGPHKFHYRALRWLFGTLEAYIPRFRSLEIIDAHSRLPLPSSTTKAHFGDELLLQNLEDLSVTTTARVARHCILDNISAAKALRSLRLRIERPHTPRDFVEEETGEDNYTIPTLKSSVLVVDIFLRPVYTTNLLGRVACLPNLRRLRLKFHGHPHHSFADTPATPNTSTSGVALEFPLLEVLSVQIGTQDLGALHILNAPRLVHLQIWAGHFFQKFWLNSRFPMLETLQLIDLRVIDHNVVRFMRLHHRTLQTLSYYIHTVDGERFLVSLAGAGAVAPGSAAHAVQSWFPNLRRLRCVSYATLPEAMQSIAKVRGILEERKQLRVEWVNTTHHLWSSSSSLKEAINSIERVMYETEEDIFSNFF